MNVTSCARVILINEVLDNIFSHEDQITFSLLISNMMVTI